VDVDEPVLLLTIELNTSGAQIMGSVEGRAFVGMLELIGLLEEARAAAAARA
jgi:hypothetical protein